MHGSVIVLGGSAEEECHWGLGLAVAFDEWAAHCSLEVVLNYGVDGSTASQHDSDAASEPQSEFRENSSFDGSSFGFLSFDHAINQSFDALTNFIVDSGYRDNNCGFDGNVIFFQFEHVST